MLGPEAKKATDVAPKEKAKTIFAKIDVNGDKVSGITTFQTVTSFCFEQKK